MSKYFDKKDLFLNPEVTQYGNHFVMTNTHKETKKIYWNIDTRFRDDYDQYSKVVSGSAIPSYTFTLPQPIHEVKSIMICNIEIPMSFYNVSSQLGNNMMKITRLGTSTLIVLRDGFYTPTTLRTEINAQLAGHYLTCDISANSHVYFTPLDPSFNAITIEFAVKISTECEGNIKSGTLTGEFDRYNIKSKLGWMLGFRQLQYTVTNASIISESVLDVIGPRYLYLTIDEFHNGQINSFISPLSNSIINKNIIAKISMDYQHYGYGTILPANQLNGLLLSDRRVYSLEKVDIQKLKMQLVNEYGMPVSLNGLDFSFSMEINTTM